MPGSDLRGLDFGKLTREEGGTPPHLRDLEQRASARLVPLRPITPDERLAAFREVGFRPHGLYWPTEPALRARVKVALERIGAVKAHDTRLGQYHALQDWTAALERRGVEGAWNGQQGISRSSARFRLAAIGRRGGKTTLAAHEGIAVTRTRPRSLVWVAARTMPIVARCFDMIVQLTADLRIPVATMRNSAQEKLIVYQNGARVEGVSLEHIFNREAETKSATSAVGAAVDLAIVDEAAQVGEEAWTRVILPPLTDRNGQALLISSYEGDTGFFAEKANTALRAGETDWAVFQDASFDVNFYSFPQGRRTPALVAIEKETSPLDFLEQYGAIPASKRLQVYPEFRERVHVGHYPFDPSRPVTLTVDPSGGSNPYCVLAIQDYGDYAIVVDEYYQTHVIAEEVAPVLQKRPWRQNITEMVVDSASPAEIERWARMGWPAVPVFEKPKVFERIPIHRAYLRDPLRFHAFYRGKVNDVLARMGLPPDSDLDLSPEQQRALALDVEESLSDEAMTEDDYTALRGCARLFINASCYFTIKEHRIYRYRRPRTGSVNIREEPLDADNHAMDALGYFFWQYHRFDDEQRATLGAYLGVEPAPRGLPRTLSTPREQVEAPDPTVAPPRTNHFLETMRAAADAAPRRPKTILRAG